VVSMRQPDDILERDVSYVGEEISVRELESTISEERRQQNQNVRTLSNLREQNVEIQQDLAEEVDKLKELTEHLDEERERSGFVASLRDIMAKLPWVEDQIITRKSIEQLLRDQYEISSRRVKQAAEFADRLAVAKENLYDEIERLNDKIVESAQNEELAAERVYELTELKERLERDKQQAEAGSHTARRLQAKLDDTQRALARHSTKLKLYGSAEDRLAELQNNTRQLAETIANLQRDITTYVTAASEKLDLIAGQIQSIGAAADASIVMLELKSSLEAMTESVNHTTRFVSETQAYFRQNVDEMVDDLELYDRETEDVLNKNLALNQMVEDEQIAEAVSTALAHEVHDDEGVSLDDIKDATIDDLERMPADVELEDSGVTLPRPDADEFDSTDDQKATQPERVHTTESSG
jgi:DNA repair exonuclease SbcCD ATPase subunit